MPRVCRRILWWWYWRRDREERELEEELRAHIAIETGQRLEAGDIHDVRTSGRLHPATLWGGGLVLIGAVSRNWISHTDLWLALARSCAS
jgi:hypothetical protein